MTTKLEGSRQRAAETKRRRTRAALLEAGKTLFSERGWYGTRMEDVAKAAGVGVATAYNHFGSKQALIGHIYWPLVKDSMEETPFAIEEFGPKTAIRLYIHRLSCLTRDHRDLTVVLFAAIQEQRIRKEIENPSDPEDVRNIVPLSQRLVEIISYGQSVGVFLEHVSAKDKATDFVSALLYRVLSYPEEKAKRSAAWVIRQLLRDIEKREMEGESSYLPGLISGDNHPTIKDRTTVDFLEAGFRLIVRQLSGERDYQEGSSVFFDWLEEKNVVAEGNKAREEQIDRADFRCRWPFRSDYIDDLLKYCLWNKHWWPQTVAADRAIRRLKESVSVADDESSFNVDGPGAVQAIHEAAYQELHAATNNPAVRLMFIGATISDRYPELKADMGEVYEKIHEKWIPIYQGMLDAYGVRLRPDVSIEDLADILSALSDGLALRMKSDPKVKFIDHEKQNSLLGKAVLMMLVGGVDEENTQQEGVESRFTRLVEKV